MRKCKNEIALYQDENAVEGNECEGPAGHEVWDMLTLGCPVDA